MSTGTKAGLFVFLYFFIQSQADAPLWKPPPTGRPSMAFTAMMALTVAPEPAPSGMAAVSTSGLVIPASLAYSSIPFLAPPAAWVRTSILPFVPGSVALKARMMDESISLSLTASNSSGVMLALMELWIALSATPISVAYLTPKALTLGALESIRKGAS